MKRFGTAIWVSAAAAATLVVSVLVLSAPSPAEERESVAPAVQTAAAKDASGSDCCNMPAASMTCPPGCPETPTCKPAASQAATAIASAPAVEPAESAPAVAPTALSAPSAATPAAGGMVIAIDPETGEYGMPSPEQLEALSKSSLEALNWSDEGLVEMHHPDGSVSLDLQGRFQQYTVVSIRPDGSKELQCGDDPAAHTHHVASSEPAPVPAVLEEE